jgi:hypothetical protein
LSIHTVSFFRLTRWHWNSKTITYLNDRFQTVLLEILNLENLEFLLTFGTRKIFSTSDIIIKVNISVSKFQALKGFEDWNSRVSKFKEFEVSGLLSFKFSRFLGIRGLEVSKNLGFRSSRCQGIEASVFRFKVLRWHRF